MKDSLIYKNSALRLMAGRTGYNSQPQFSSSVQPEINNMAEKLKYNGGFPQQDRMIRDKKRTLDKAVLYSYQGAFVKKVDWEERPPVRGLINPNKLKQDYDDKIISIGYEHEFQSGDVFEWCNTNSYWIIYLQDLDELAYFRGDIRRCRYQIEWLDEEGEKHSTYVAVRGPVETKINYIQKHGISVDTPNHSLDMLMPLNEHTKKYFKRYNKFYLQDDEVCWRVEAIDWISMPNILEVIAVEYYANETEDDVDNGLVGAFVTKMVEPEVDVKRDIVGDTFIKPKIEYTYYVETKEPGTWHVSNPKAPVSLEPFETARGIHGVKLTWNSSQSGQFVLQYGDENDKEYYKHFSKTIVVESLF